MSSSPAGNVPAADAPTGTDVPAHDAPTGKPAEARGTKRARTTYESLLPDAAYWTAQSARQAVRKDAVSILQGAGMTEAEARKVVNDVFGQLNQVAATAGNPAQVAAADAKSAALDQSIALAKQWLKDAPLPQAVSQAPPAKVVKFLGAKLADGASEAAAGVYAILAAGKHVLGFGGPTEAGDSPGIDWAHLGGIDWGSIAPSGGKGTGIGQDESAFLFGVSWDVTTK